MKLYSGLLILAAATFVTACSQDETVDERLTNGAIGFAPLLNHNTSSNTAKTRSAKIVSGETADAFNGFYVWAYTTTGGSGTDNAQYMSHDYSGTNWGTPILKAATAGSGNGWKQDDTGIYYGYKYETDLRYWPKQELEFFALGPLNISGDDPQGSITNLTFTTPTTRPTDNKYSFTYTAEADIGSTKANLDKQTDILYATARQTGTVGNSTVNMNFNHALAKVQFKGQVAANQPGMKVLVESVKLCNLKTTGTCTVTINNATTNTIAWSGQTTDGNYTLTPPSAVEGSATTNTVTLSANSTVTSPGTQVDLSDEFLIIPQTTTAWTTNKTTAVSLPAAGGNSYLAVQCAIYQVDGVPIVGTYSGSKYTTETVYVPLGGTWEKGHSYVYNLQFGVGYDAAGKVISEPITFSVTVSTWGTTTSSDVPL